MNILYLCSTIYNDIGCEYDGECLPLHMSIQEGCSWKKCVIAAEGPNFIDTRLITEHGKIAYSSVSFIQMLLFSFN